MFSISISNQQVNAWFWVLVQVLQGPLVTAAVSAAQRVMCASRTKSPAAKRAVSPAVCSAQWSVQLRTHTHAHVAHEHFRAPVTCSLVSYLCLASVGTESQPQESCQGMFSVHAVQMQGF
jgi:hypothetical protein